MGFNSTIVILNDGLHAIAEDKAFGEKLRDAIQQKYCRDKDRAILYSGNGNVGEVVDVQHADYTQVVAVGGNYGTRLAITCGYSHHRPEEKLAIARELARQLGYTLRKMPKEG